MFSGSLRMHFKHLFLAKTNMKRDLKFYKIPKYGLISIYQNIQKQTEMFILILEMINQCFEVKIRIIYHRQMKNMFFYFLEKVPPLPSSSSWSTLEEESATLLKAHAWKGGNVLGTYSDLT